MAGPGGSHLEDAADHADNAIDGDGRTSELTHLVAQVFDAGDGHLVELLRSEARQERFVEARVQGLSVAGLAVGFGLDPFLGPGGDLRAIEILAARDFDRGLSQA